MEDWKKKLIEKADEVVKHGWGRVEICITNNGKKKAYTQTFTEVEDEKSLQKPANIV